MNSNMHRYIKSMHKRMCLCMIEYLKWFVAACFALSIFIIQLTEWRPFGYSEKGDEINSIILNLAYSYLAAIFFHLCMVFIPSLHRKKIMRFKIEYYLSKLYSSIRQCVNGVYLLSYDHQNNMHVPRKKFLDEFCSKDMTPPCDYLMILEKKSCEIKMLIDSLVELREYLTDKEVHILLLIMDAPFLTEKIRPREYIESEDGVKTELTNNNQNEIAKSIYYLYKQIKTLRK